MLGLLADRLFLAEIRNLSARLLTQFSGLRFVEWAGGIIPAIRPEERQIGSFVLALKEKVVFSLISWRRPSQVRVERFLEKQSGEPFSYHDLGMTAPILSTENGPAGWRVARYRGLVGQGESDFLLAVEAIRQWKMFPARVVDMDDAPGPIQPGTVVVPRLRAMGLWILAACRIVYVVDDREVSEEGQSARYGFAYGTLHDHPERGEERFLVEWRKDDDTVWYELTAVSQHHSLISRLAHPFTRWAQNRFCRLSVVAMQDAVAESRDGASEVAECRSK